MLVLKFNFSTHWKGINKNKMRGSRGGLEGSEGSWPLLQNLVSLNIHYKFTKNLPQPPPPPGRHK